MEPAASQFLGLAINDGTDTLAAELKNLPGGARGLDNAGAVSVSVDHGLLAVNILAGIHGVDGDLLMPVIGRADDDGVDVGASKNFLVVAGSEDVVAPEFLAVLQASVVTVGGGDEFHAGDLNGDPRVSLPLAAGANEGDLDVIVGGEAGSRRIVGCERDHFGAEPGCGRRGAGDSKEISAI